MDSSVNNVAEQRRKKKRKNKIMKFLFVLILSSFVLGLYLLKDAWIPHFEDLVYDIRVMTRGKNSNSDFPIKIETSSEYQIGRVDKKFAVLSDTYYTVYDLKGDEVFSSQHTMTNAIMKTAGKRALIYNQGSFRFKVSTEYKDVYEKKLDDQIIYATISDEGYVAVVTNSDKYQSFLTIYNEKGEEIFYSSSSEKILSVAFTHRSKGCIISTMSIHNSEIVSKIHSYKFDTEKKIWSSSTIPVLTLDLKILQNNDIMLVGDKSAYVLSSEGNILESYTYTSSLKDFYIKDNTLILSEANESLRKYSAVIYSKGNGPVIINSKNEIRKVYLSKNNAYCITDNSLEVYSQNGNLLDEIRLDYLFNNIVAFDDEVFLLGETVVDKFVVIT